LALIWLRRVWGRLGHEDNTLDGIVARAAMEHTHCAEGEDGEVATQDWTLLANNASPIMQLEFAKAGQLEVGNVQADVNLAGTVSISFLSHRHLLWAADCKAGTAALLATSATQASTDALKNAGRAAHSLHPEAVSWASIVWGRLGQDDNTLAGMPVKMSLEHMQWASGPAGDWATHDATAPAN